jgi:hypothetical protein
MAQLSDDCFAFGGTLLTIAAALAEIEARVRAVVETEMAPLPVAAGRILARDLIATMNLPPHANSAKLFFRSPEGLPPATLSTAPSVEARRSGSSPVRQCPTAPTP